LKLRFTRHANDKLTLLQGLGVDRERVLKAIVEPDEVLYDVETDHLVAVRYGDNLAVVFDYEGSGVVVVTVIYSTRLRSIVERRRARGRWV